VKAAKDRLYATLDIVLQLAICSFVGVPKVASRLPTVRRRFLSAIPMTHNVIHSEKFEPFYDRFARNTCAKLIISFSFGLFFFIIQWLSLGRRIWDNWGWMLALLISCAVLFLYYATATFRHVLLQMEARLGKNSLAKLLNYGNKVLSDRAFIEAGLFFALLNTTMGALFGLPQNYQGFWAVATSYIGFFIVGFVCGIPAHGIFGVWRVFRAFAQDETLKVDYTASDGCGGMQFIGDALIRFASVTLTMGILIAWYILHMHWLRSENILVKVVLLLWVVWPFILSTFVLFIPSLAIHQALEKAKQREDARLQERINAFQLKIDNSSSPQPESFMRSYEHYTGRRAALYKMQTWPYDLKSKINYAGVLLINTGVAVENVRKYWPNITATFKA
jgi:hypothetical protein